VWYCEFSNMKEEEKEEVKRALLALLRSLSFLTSPTNMFNFLTDQVRKREQLLPTELQSRET